MHQNGNSLAGKAGRLGLPELTDRRERLAKALGKKNIESRFGDKIQLTGEEIRNNNSFAEAWYLVSHFSSEAQRLPRKRSRSEHSIASGKGISGS